MTSVATTEIYDSAARRRPVIGEFRNLWRHRELIRLLVTRDLTVRYKRSFLGMAWTLLTPLLTMMVMWMVFSQVFKFEIPGTNFAVYLLSGILIVTFFAQGVTAAGSAVVNNAQILTKVYVPPEVFSFSAAVAAAVNFGISLAPLLVIQLAVGMGIPWTVVLVPIPAILLLAFTAGVGLLVAAGAVYFYDVLSLTEVVLQLIGYLTPTFYPLTIIPEHFLPVIYANPLYSYLLVFRGFVYEGTMAPWWAWAMMIGSAVLSLYVGVLVFHRVWSRLVVLI